MNLRSHVIEVIQSTPDWWIAWLPVLGSVVVAAAAFTGVILSNRTNRKAIDAADQREWVKWQREQLSTLANELLSVAHLCCARMKGFTLWTKDQSIGELLDINNEYAAIPNIARKLELIAGSALSRQCDDVHKTLAECAEVIQQYAPSGAVVRAEREDADKAMNQRAKAVAEAMRNFSAAVRTHLEQGVSGA